MVLSFDTFSVFGFLLDRTSPNSITMNSIARIKVNILYVTIDGKLRDKISKMDIPLHHARSSLRLFMKLHLVKMFLFTLPSSETMFDFLGSSDVIVF